MNSDVNTVSALLDEKLAIIAKIDEESVRSAETLTALTVAVSSLDKSTVKIGSDATLAGIVRDINTFHFERINTLSQVMEDTLGEMRVLLEFQMEQREAISGICDVINKLLVELGIP